MACLRTLCRMLPTLGVAYIEVEPQRIISWDDSRDSDPA